jgi:hypothetical protein
MKRIWCLALVALGALMLSAAPSSTASPSREPSARLSESRPCEITVVGSWSHDWPVAYVEIHWYFDGVDQGMDTVYATPNRRAKALFPFGKAASAEPHIFRATLDFYPSEEGFVYPASAELVTNCTLTS